MISLLELFGGIGGPRAAFDNIGVPVESMDYVEIDPIAVSAYNTLYGETYPTQDVTTWKKRELRGKVDLLVHGSPCQDFSIGGLQQGGCKGSNTRSSLLWVSSNIIKNILPSVVLWENVPNVLSKKHRDVFRGYLSYLEQLGYTNQVFCINSIECGSIQSRTRVYVVSNRLDRKVHIYKNLHHHSLSEICNSTVSNNYYIPQSHYDWFCKYGRQKLIGKHGLIRAGTFYDFGSPYIRCSRARVYSVEGACPTLTTFVTPMIEVQNGIRYITPKEAFLVQGFSETAFERLVPLQLTDKQLYKLVGNSMDIKTMEQVIKAIVRLLEDEI